jgi:hypothetical protein
MIYTKIPKPTSTTYTGVYQTQGKQIYDQSDLTYDDVNTFYDSINLYQYTNVAKPLSTTYTKIAKPI